MGFLLGASLGLKFIGDGPPTPTSHQIWGHIVYDSKYLAGWAGGFEFEAILGLQRESLSLKTKQQKH